jgi:hypothetical protein
MKLSSWQVLPVAWVLMAACSDEDTGGKGGAITDDPLDGGGSAGRGGNRGGGGTGGEAPAGGGGSGQSGSGGARGPDGSAGAANPSGGSTGTEGGVPDAAIAADRPTEPPPPGGAPAVIMRGYNLNRTGANLAETALTPQSVSPSGFGKLYCRPVDEEIYGQILYVPGLDLGAKGRHNTIFVVTMNDSVYAFDADSGQGGALWEQHWTDEAKGITAVPTRDLARTSCGVYKDISRQVGILSTPTIDLAGGTMYLVARTKEGTRYFQRLHAISLADGSERPGSPVAIDFSGPGDGDGSVGGMIRFDPMRQNQRAGLLLHQGVVYIAWSSHCDEGPYHGWIAGYDAKTLARVVLYNDTPGGKFGGIWMAGQAPSVDEDGNIYVITGNGTADLTGQGGPNRGQSFIKLRRNGGTLDLVDWFTPYNYAILEEQDRDLGSSGAVLIPGSRMILGGGKEGKLYLLDRMNFGHYRAGNDGQILQTVVVTGPGRAHIHGTPVYWKSSQGEFIYVMGEEDYLKQYLLVDGRLQLYKMSAVRAPNNGPKPNGYIMPGGALALSASGTSAGSGIVWASVNISMDANNAVVPGMLRAFDASDVSKELWNSEANASRDSYGLFPKFNPPTVVGGKVYQATFSKQFCVYGRL